LAAAHDERLDDMSGLYLEYRPAGLAADADAAFAKRFAAGATRTDGDVVVKVTGTGFIGVAVDHGHFPTGGTASEGETLLLATGSCWLDEDATDLATPAQILAEWNRRRPATEEPFRGVFALAHLDQSRQTLRVETDRFGTVPLYHRRLDDGGIAVASEIKFLLHPGHDRLDMDGLADLVGFGFHVRPATLVAGITRLPAHHVLEFGPQGLRIGRLPTPGFPRDLPVTEDSIAAFDHAVQKSLARYARAKSEVSVSLSGGLDSRLLMLAALRAGMRLTSFSSGEPGNIDVAMARRIAARWNLEFHAHEVDGRRLPDWFGPATAITEGRVLPNHCHYLDFAFTKGLPKSPQLHGLIGEAVIGGYLENASLRSATAAQRRQGCYDFGRSVIGWRPGMQARILSPALAKLTAAPRDAVDALLGELGFRGEYEDYLLFKFVFRGGLLTVPTLTGQVLPWTDVVSPFLDPDIFDFGARFASEDIGDRVVQLRWGLQVMPEIADLPRVKDGIIMPFRDDDPAAYARQLPGFRRRQRLRSLVCRASLGRVNLPDREGFPHYAQWYRRWPEVRRYVDEVVLSPRCLDRGLYQADGLRQLMCSMRRGRNVWNIAGTILMVELLCRRFLDD